MWLTWTWFRCKKERSYLTSLFLSFMPRVWIGEGGRTNEDLMKLWFPPLPLMHNKQIEGDRNSKLLLFIFVVNKVKIGVDKNGVPLCPISVKTQHTIVPGQINFQSKNTGKTAGESEPYDGISAVLWKKKKCFHCFWSEGKQGKLCLKCVSFCLLLKWWCDQRHNLTVKEQLFPGHCPEIKLYLRK